MLHCGHHWQPTEVSRVVELVESSTQVAKVATDAGFAFLKGLGNPQGAESLASELVGSELAVAVGLAVPHFAVVELVGIEVPMLRGGILLPGPAFLSRAMRGGPSVGSAAHLRRLTNVHHIPLIVAFDTWVRNVDRCPPPDYFDPTPKLDNLFFTPRGRRLEMIAYDHTHCFVEEDLESGLGNEFVEDNRIFGVFPEFRRFLDEQGLRRAAVAIASVDADDIREIVGSIPRQWGPTGKVRSRWAELIIERGARLEEILISQLVPQLQLNV